MLYKLQEGLDEEGQVKLNTELERTARKIQHPLAKVVIEPASIAKKRPTSTATPAVKPERTPPPGWLDEQTAYKNAMMLMNFNGKKGRK